MSLNFSGKNVIVTGGRSLRKSGWKYALPHLQLAGTPCCLQFASTLPRNVRPLPFRRNDLSERTGKTHRSNNLLIAGHFYANKNLIRIFCNSLIVKDSHEDTGIQLKNSVLRQAKMVSIYQRNNINDTAKKVATISFDSCEKFNHL